MSGMLVLVVDTQKDSLAQTCAQLSGHTVITAHSLGEATKVLDGVRPQVAILDMPEDGFDSGIEFLRLHVCNTVFAVLTPNTFSADTRCDLLEAGASAVMTKPVLERELRLVVQRILELSKTADILQSSSNALFEAGAGLRCPSSLEARLAHIHKIYDDVLSDQQARKVACTAQIQK